MLAVAALRAGMRSRVLSIWVLCLAGVGSVGLMVRSAALLLTIGLMGACADGTAFPATSSAVATTEATTTTSTTLPTPTTTTTRRPGSNSFTWGAGYAEVGILEGPRMNGMSNEVVVAGKLVEIYEAEIDFYGEAIPSWFARF